MADSTTSIDAILSAFSPQQQDAIKALIAQEAAKNAPATPKELTPKEQIEQHITLARQSLQHAGNPVFYQDRVLSALEMLASVVYPDETALEDSSASADTTASTADTSSQNTGSAI